MKDQYHSISRKGESLYKEKGSKFFGKAYPCKNKAELKEILDLLKKEYHSARHFCFAYRFNPEKPEERANDDGEPSNSAGAPILGQIYSRELYNVVVIVIRYFGGTKLGVPGLIRSYKTSAMEALLDAEIAEFQITSRFKVTSDYKNVNELMRLIKKHDIKIISQESAEKMSVLAEVRKSEFKYIEDIFKQKFQFIFETQ
ncbi:MAG: YigZ family protein [Schleiferiaceae bacterium]|jgi:uncharacterized YigZ family protein|nr:YigZ family protein [Schleiferiaceae bacterium]